MNVVVLKGNLVRDPELRHVGSDNKTSVTNFTVAVNRHFKRADGSKDKETTYVDCELWDTAAEHLAEYCSQGDPILIQGSLKLDSWETDGQKRSRLKVRVNNFDRLFKAPARDGESSGGSAVQESQEHQEVAVGTGEDIPF